MSRKWRQEGSVENRDGQQNHDVVSQGEQVQVAALAPEASPSDVGALSPFDHRHHGFDLSAFAIDIEVKADLHQSPVVSAGRLDRGPTMLGRDHRA